MKLNIVELSKGENENTQSKLKFNKANKVKIKIFLDSRWKGNDINF